MIKLKLICVFTFVIITNVNAQNAVNPVQQNIGNRSQNIGDQQDYFVVLNTNMQQNVINNSNLNNNQVNNSTYLAQANERPNINIQTFAPQQIMLNNYNPGNQENEINNYDQTNGDVDANSTNVSQKRNKGLREIKKFTKPQTSGHFSNKVSRWKKKLNYFCFRTSKKMNSVFATHKTKKSDYSCFVW